MEPHSFNYLGKLFIACSLATVTFTACQPEDEDFFDFRPVTFYITASDLTVEAGRSIIYNDGSIDAVSREWTFEGGTPATSTEIMPEITYPEEGDFLTFVTTTFADGTTQRRRLEITVVPPIVPDFAGLPTALQFGNDVQFNNLTTGVGAIPDSYTAADTNVVFQWIFEGTGLDTVTDNHPKITYNELGTFDVTLIVTRKSTNSREMITKTDYINVLDVPVTQARAAKFNRDGSALLLSFSEPVGVVSDEELSKFSLTSSTGAGVTIISAEIPAWSDNILQLNVDPGSLVVGEDYTLSFSETGTVTVESGSALLPFSFSSSYLGTMQDWAVNYFGDGNTSVTAMLNGQTFTFTTSGYTFTNADGNPAHTIFSTGAANVSQNFHTSASPFNMLIAPGAGAGLEDLGDVAFELYYFGPEGTEYTFSQPVTDLRFHNVFANIPEATLSADGQTITITKQVNRAQNLRVTGILEGPISENGITVTHNAPEGSAVYVTASGKP